MPSQTLFTQALTLHQRGQLQEAEALYRTTGYTEIDKPLPSWGPFRPIAFGKGLP